MPRTPDSTVTSARGDGAQRTGEHASREQLIVDLWARGLSYRAIGRELGIGERPTAGLISRLRAQGWDLPPRR